MINKKKIVNKLREKGYRITPQREKILELFMELPEGSHLSAEDLHALLLQNQIKISLATLYRTLKFLVLNSLLRELDFGEDHKHYELSSVKKHHHHLICNNCGMTIEFHDEKLIKMAKSIAEKQNRFKGLDYQFKIFGLCEKCSSNP